MSEAHYYRLQYFGSGGDTETRVERAFTAADALTQFQNHRRWRCGFPDLTPVRGIEPVVDAGEIASLNSKWEAARKEGDLRPWRGDA